MKTLWDIIRFILYFQVMVIIPFGITYSLSKKFNKRHKDSWWGL